MEQYILNLLKENKRIIIPDFGAFIIRPLNPPEIAFNGLLTFNDGILTEYVSKQTSISYVEAAAKVSDYVEKLKTDLHHHNRLTFNEIGWVWTDDSGEIQFTAWKVTGDTTVKSRTGMKDLNSILKDAELSMKSDEQKIQDLKEDTKTPVSSEDITKGETVHPKTDLEPSVNSPDQTPFTLDETLKEVDVDATKDVLTKKTSDSAIDSGKITGESFTLEESDKSVIPEQIPSERPVIIPVSHSEPVIQTTAQKDEKDTLLDEKIMASLSAIRSKNESLKTGSRDIPKEISPSDDWRRAEIKSTLSSQSKKDKKRRSWILPVSIIGLFIILAGAAYLISPDQVKDIINPILQQPDKTLIEVEQVPTEDAAPSYDEESVSPDQETPVVSDINQGADRKYYIVAGRFRNKVNADNYVSSLLTKGFNAELFRTDDNLYTVSFSSFSSRAQAEEELKRIRQTTEPDAWILLY
jgi:hypothetical protein